MWRPPAMPSRSHMLTELEINGCGRASPRNATRVTTIPEALEKLNDQGNARSHDAHTHMPTHTHIHACCLCAGRPPLTYHLRAAPTCRSCATILPPMFRPTTPPTFRPCAIHAMPSRRPCAPRSQPARRICAARAPHVPRPSAKACCPQAACIGHALAMPVVHAPGCTCRPQPASPAQESPETQEWRQLAIFHPSAFRAPHLRERPLAAKSKRRYVTVAFETWRPSRHLIDLVLVVGVCVCCWI